MKCEKCKTDTDAGEWYQSYYGTLLASWTSYQRRYVDALERVISKKYRTEGSEKVFFCIVMNYVLTNSTPTAKAKVAV